MYVFFEHPFDFVAAHQKQVTDIAQRRGRVYIVFYIVDYFSELLI